MARTRVALSVVPVSAVRAAASGYGIPCMSEALGG